MHQKETEDLYKKIRDFLKIKKKPCGEHIRTLWAPGTLVLCKEDNGIGIIAENTGPKSRPYAFSKFFFTKKGNLKEIGGAAWFKEEEFKKIADPTVETKALLKIYYEGE